MRKKKMISEISRLNGIVKDLNNRLCKIEDSDNKSLNDIFINEFLRPKYIGKTVKHIVNGELKEFKIDEMRIVDSEIHFHTGYYHIFLGWCNTVKLSDCVFSDSEKKGK